MGKGNEDKTWGGPREGSGRKSKNLVRKVITYALTEEQWAALEKEANGKLSAYFNRMRSEEANKLMKRQKSKESEVIKDQE